MSQMTRPKVSFTTNEPPDDHGGSITFLKAADDPSITSSTMMTTAAKTEITLKGSVEIVSDFFFTAINSILYQR